MVFSAPYAVVRCVANVGFLHHNRMVDSAAGAGFVGLTTLFLNMVSSFLSLL
jgi:hypothetical protein